MHFLILLLALSAKTNAHSFPMYSLVLGVVLSAKYDVKG